MNDEIICSVCGKKATEHGDGIKFPRTLCLLCYKFRLKQNKIDKELEKQRKCG